MAFFDFGLIHNVGSILINPEILSASSVSFPLLSYLYSAVILS